MCNVLQISNFGSIIEPHLNGARFVSYTSNYLTKPGDNYGSVMLSVNAKIRRTNGELAELPLIAKLPPINNDVCWQLFKPERTCLTENAVYAYLLPELEKLQLEAGVPADQFFDGFARYYGSRISLDANASQVDRDAVLLQENLQVAGYKSGDRLQPYDLKHTVLIVKYMAQYHALPIALRFKKPDIFNKLIRPYFAKFNMSTNMEEQVYTTITAETLNDVAVVTNNNQELIAHVKELITIYENFQAKSEVTDGPYNSLVHSDLWINNIMIKYATDGTPARLKFVDFQIAEYESIVHDIIFFLLSSVQTAVVEQNYNELLRIYFESFIECLQKIKVDTDIYSYEGFRAEIKRYGHIQIGHVLHMIKVIMADKSTIPKDYKDIDMSVISKNAGTTAILEKNKDILRLTQKLDIFD